MSGARRWRLQPSRRLGQRKHRVGDDCRRGLHHPYSLAFLVCLCAAVLPTTASGFSSHRHLHPWPRGEHLRRAEIACWLAIVALQMRSLLLLGLNPLPPCCPDLPAAALISLRKQTRGERPNSNAPPQTFTFKTWWQITATSSATAKQDRATCELHPLAGWDGKRGVPRALPRPVGSQLANPL